MQFHCTPCKRDFGDKQALNKHLRHASAHISVVDCQPCKKSFVNQDALDQHLRDSPAHKITFPCEPCNRSFVNQDALDQHLRDAPAHGAPTFDCELCNRSFVHQEALDSHVQTARIHQRRVNTPLDNFFRSYPDFAYDPSLPPAMSYASLQKHKRWRRWQSESNEAWESYQNALNAELEMWYGAEDDLTAWHALCRAIGISPPPATCERCEQAARRTHVNIVDLVEWGRGDRNGTVHTFRSVKDLREYTQNTHKIFDKATITKQSVVLRHLLRKLFPTSIQRVG